MENNTVFYCCEDLKDDIESGDWTLKETVDMHTNLRFCPYCGHKLSSL